jgi:hypothetical protein
MGSFSDHSRDLKQEHFKTKKLVQAYQTLTFKEQQRHMVKVPHSRDVEDIGTLTTPVLALDVLVL